MKVVLVFTSFFKDKKSKRSHKTVEIKGFLLFLLDDRRILNRVRILVAQNMCIRWIRIRTDPDSEH
jgi:hypothetical protein